MYQPDRTVLTNGGTQPEPAPLFPDANTLHSLDTIDAQGHWALKVETMNAPSFRRVRVWVAEKADHDHRGPTVFIEGVAYGNDHDDWEPLVRYDGYKPPFSVCGF